MARKTTANNRTTVTKDAAPVTTEVETTTTETPVEEVTSQEADAPEAVATPEVADPVASLTPVGELIHAKYGAAALDTIITMEAAINRFDTTDFSTSRSTNADKEASFDALLNMYTEMLNSPLEAIPAAFELVSHYYTQNRQGTFRPMRTMMLPITTRNISPQVARFVSDMNQLMSALARANNANSLRKIVRIEAIVSSMRSEKQRLALTHFISTIDI